MSEPAAPELQGAMNALASTCESIAQGRFEEIDMLYEIVANEGLPSDIRELAETFGSMVVQIEAREFHGNQLIDELKEAKRQLEAAQKQLVRENTSLKQKLKKLDVQYDESQAEIEIQEIVESDYFRELQDRAKSLRAKFNSGT